MEVTKKNNKTLFNKKVENLSSLDELSILLKPSILQKYMSARGKHVKIPNKYVKEEGE